MYYSERYITSKDKSVLSLLIRSKGPIRGICGVTVYCIHIFSFGALGEGFQGFRPQIQIPDQKMYIFRLWNRRQLLILKGRYSVNNET